MESTQTITKATRQLAPFLCVVVGAFFVYLLCLLLNSFSADYRIYQTVAAYVSEHGFDFWKVYWLFSELVGEVGLFVRFSGACLLLAFTMWLLWRRTPRFALLRKAILLEGLYYLFFIPFIGLELFSPNASMAYHLAASSYILQALLITPAFLALYIKLRSPQLNLGIKKWFALCAVTFTFALWIKHFLFSLYALPADSASPILLIGSANSIITLLVGALLVLFALFPTMKGKAGYHRRVLGVGLCFVGAYFLVYLLVAAFSGGYLSYLWLTDFWASSLVVLGLGFLLKKPC
ncbi:MAG: hypothetical protein NWE93_03885 [Candidatus Bathyarchaeota archaeon]|nr:hypothetical protein [Candidatus Bathyarchaeota archaeon]